MPLTESLPEKEYEELLARAHARDDLLRKEVGEDVEATWEPAKDQYGHPALQLKLRAPSGARCLAVIESLELRVPDRLVPHLADMKKTLAKLGQWLKILEGFYQLVRQWSTQFPPDWQVREEPIVVQERARQEDDIDLVRPSAQDIAEYDAIQFRITVGDTEVTVRPLALWVPATNGLVRLTGRYLSDWMDFSFSPEEGGWHYLPDDPGNPELPLTAELFRQLLNESTE
jgi:hypothetical protein